MGEPKVVYGRKWCCSCGSAWSFMGADGKVYCHSCQTQLDPPGRFPPPPELRPTNHLIEDTTATLLAQFLGPRLEAILDQLEHIDRQLSHSTGLPTLIEERMADVI